MPEFTHRDNFIKIAANRNNIRAKKIFDAIDFALKSGKADPDIFDLYTSFHPYNLVYEDGYSVWSSLKRSNAGKTLGVVQIVEQLSHTKIKAWDIAIQAVYENTTVQYKSLLPNHRYPFNSGTVNARYIAITDLLTTMGTDASLTPTKTNITAFALLLKNAMDMQKDQVNDIDNALVALDAASNDASDEAFRIFGCLITKFYKTPKSIDAYFPVAMFQNVAQFSFTSTLKNKKPKKVFKRKLDILKQIMRITNISTEIINGYFTNGLSDVHTPGTPVLSILPNTIVDCNPAEMGYTEDKRHFHIVNTGLTEASIEIDIMSVN